MQTSHILSAPLIDIIFDGRNKAYGAYELRKTYEKRVRKALFVTGLITSLAIGTAILASSIKKKDPDYRISGGILIQDIPEEKKPEKLPETKKPKEPELQTQTERFNDPVVKPDDQVESPPPSQTDLDLAKIDIDTRTGTTDDRTVEPALHQIDGGTGIIDDKLTKETGPAETVDIDAKFNGNWKRFLETNLDAEVPVENGAPEGRYSVVVRFVVDTDGDISEITQLTAHGFGLEEEAVRVIRKAKKWEPAFLNGVHVKAYKKQVIVFVVE